MTRRTVPQLYCDGCGNGIDHGRMFELDIADVDGSPRPADLSKLHFCTGKCLGDWATNGKHDEVPATLVNTQKTVEGLALPDDPEALRDVARRIVQTSSPMSGAYEHRILSAQLIFRFADIAERIGAIGAIGPVYDPENKDRDNDREAVFGAGQWKCVSCGWKNSEVRPTCRNCRTPAPKASE